MNFKIITIFFQFTRGQRTGIAVLFTVIIVLQLAYFFVDFSILPKENSAKQKWLSLQTQIDSLKREKVDYKPKMYPFNPNFITDYKGYKLGMSTQEIDRLLAFRKLGKFANSPKEFQAVTKISDSLLDAISPFFKFPDWVNNKSESNYQEYKNDNYKKFPEKEKLVVKDINLATQEDLMKIYGIGEAISVRILKQKETYGGFVSMGQMQEVWGLSPEVIDNLNSHFKVFNQPNIAKIDINNASLKELSQFPYFRYALAKQIVTYRSMNGDIKVEDLSKIKDFPVDKIKIIALYLKF